MKKYQLDDLNGVLTDGAMGDLLNHLANPEGGDLAYMARMGAALSAAGAAITAKVKEEVGEGLEAGERWDDDGVTVVKRKGYSRKALKAAYSADKRPDMYTNRRVKPSVQVTVRERELERKALEAEVLALMRGA